VTPSAVRLMQLWRFNSWISSRRNEYFLIRAVDKTSRSSIVFTSFQESLWISLFVSSRAESDASGFRLSCTTVRRTSGQAWLHPGSPSKQPGWAWCKRPGKKESHVTYLIFALDISARSRSSMLVHSPVGKQSLRCFYRDCAGLSRKVAGLRGFIHNS